MDKIAEQLEVYIDKHPFGLGYSDCETVLNQPYQAYQESHESDSQEIRKSFKALDNLLNGLPLEDKNTVFNLCYSLYATYERKVFIAGL